MLFEIKKSRLVGGPVVLAIYMCPFCYTFWCFLYTVFKCSANIFTANISFLCATSPAIIHSVSHAGCMMLKKPI